MPGGEEVPNKLKKTGDPGEHMYSIQRGRRGTKREGKSRFLKPRKKNKSR